MGKGSLWRVEQQYKQNLIQALTRSAYHPGTTSDDKFNTPVKSTTRPTDALAGLKVLNISMMMIDGWLGASY